MDNRKAIESFKLNFHVKMDGLLSAIKNVQSNIKEWSGHIAETN